MKKIVFTLIVAFVSSISFAQISTLSNNKPLAFLNPALQNYEIEKGVVSASYNLSPFTLEETPSSFLAIGELEVKDGFRMGIHASQFENRLGKSTSVMAYGSLRLELEKGNYLIIGADIGGYSEVSKAAEYNKVLAPNKFFYSADSALTGRSTGLDLGLGFSYQYSGFTFGLGFNKLTKPPVFAFPEVQFEAVLVDSTLTAVKKDTTIFLEEQNFGLESNLNLIYEWNASQKVRIIHYLHFGNIDLAGFDFASFQTIGEISKKHSLGGGAFFNGTLGFMATGAFGFTEDIKLGSSIFFINDLNYDVLQEEYVSNGYKPLIEVNLRYEF